MTTPARRVEEILAQQVTDESDITGMGSYEIRGVYGRPAFVIFNDGRWCTYAREADGICFCTAPPDPHDLCLVGLLTETEYVEAMLQ